MVLLRVARHRRVVLSRVLEAALQLPLCEHDILHDPRRELTPQNLRRRGVWANLLAFYR